MDPMTMMMIAGAAKEELPGIFGKSKRDAEAERRAITLKYSPWTKQKTATGALPDTDVVGAAAEGAALGSLKGGNVFQSLIGKGTTGAVNPAQNVVSSGPSNRQFDVGGVEYAGQQSQIQRQAAPVTNAGQTRGANPFLYQ